MNLTKITKTLIEYFFNLNFEKIKIYFQKKFSLLSSFALNFFIKIINILKQVYLEKNGPWIKYYFNFFIKCSYIC